MKSPSFGHRRRIVGAITTVIAATMIAAGLITPPVAAAVSPVGHPSVICTILGSAGDDRRLQGTEGADVICGQGGNDRIFGGGGNDRIYGGPGLDSISAGAGNDVVYGDDGNDSASGNNGDDTVYGGTGGDNLHGDGIGASSPETGSDTLYGDDGSDSARGGPGDDRIHTGTSTGPDQAAGDAGNDVLVGGQALMNSFNGGAGNDLLFPSITRISVLGNVAAGGEGNDLAILVNGMRDTFERNQLVAKATAGCSLTVPVLTDENGESNWSISCPILGPVSLKVDSERNTSVTGTILNGMIKGDLGSISDIANRHLPTLTVDTCVCDLRGPGNSPFLLLREDWII